MRITTYALAGLAAVGMGALAACGGGTSMTSGGASGGATFQGALVTQHAALVTTDVDGDGKADLVAMDRSGTGAVKCWQNLGTGTYADTTGTWGACSVVGAVAGSCGAQDDTTLEGDLGVHSVPGGKTGMLPYVVMHVGEGVAAPAGPPAVDAIEPASGPGNSLAWLTGTDLAAEKEPPTVTFSGVPADVLIAFPDYVLVVVPDLAPLGPVDVVLTRGGTAAPAVAFTVTLAPAPVLTSVEPDSVTPGTIAILHGTDLGSPFDAVSVSFAGTVAEYAYSFGEAAFAVVPDGAVSGPVTITVNGVVSNPIDVTVGSLPVPTITSLVPASASPGSLVKIEGKNLFVLTALAVGPGSGAGWLDVSFHGVSASIFGFDGSAVTVIVPPAATDGDVVVTVGGRASAGVPFDVVARAAPHIASVSPSSGAVGDAIHVEGTDLCDLSGWSLYGPPIFGGGGPGLFGDLKVTIGGTEAWFVLPTATGLDVLVPSGATSGNVVVTVNGSASNAVPFTVN